MKAWLITWEWIGDHAAVDDKVLDIISARRSAEWIRVYTERLYLTSESSMAELMQCAAYNKPQKPAYRAEYGTIANGRIRYTGRITCGHNPFLFSRLVDNLEVDENDSVTWEERPLPQLPDSLFGREQ